jgi:hypothetical protein
VVALVYVDVVAGERTTQQQASVVVAFDKSDFLRPASRASRSFLRVGVPVHGAALALESDNRDLETHAL